MTLQQIKYLHWFISRQFSSELVAAENHLSDIQRELDCHKEECYAHMKVIQQLKTYQKMV